MKIVFGLVMTLVLVSSISAEENKIVEGLQEASVTIRAGSSQGSGTLITRKIGGDDVTFVLTAGHVVDGLRKTRESIVGGQTRKIVEFDDAAIVQEFKEGGRRVGETKMDAKVIKFSDADNGEDLAILRVRKKNFTKANVQFTDKTPQIGTELYHVGSLLGQDLGANSLTTGVVSQIGRVLHGQTYTQSTAPAFPGSSGGGVFLKADGRYVGMLVRGAGETLTFLVPIERIQHWTKENEIEWILDPTKEIPSVEKLDKMPVENVPSNKKDKDKDMESINERFPYLINQN